VTKTVQRHVCIGQSAGTVSESIRLPAHLWRCTCPGDAVDPILGLLCCAAFYEMMRARPEATAPPPARLVERFRSVQAAAEQCVIPNAFGALLQRSVSPPPPAV
jgi:hypothetical protein